MHALAPSEAAVTASFAAVVTFDAVASFMIVSFE
jgi:hypothetical protein